MQEWRREAGFELRRFTNESPQLIVDLPVFKIDKLPVTNARYRACIAAGVCGQVDEVSVDLPSDYNDNPRYDDYPVRGVFWDDAVAYYGWVGKRLPTEAEWEKAARGTDGRLFPWGDEWDPRGATDILRPHAVGSQAINVSPYGAYDMLGNAVEWVADWYAPDYYAHSPFRNPTGPAREEERVRRSRGGGPDLQGTPRFGLPSRSGDSPDHSFGGFRCVYVPGDGAGQ